MLVATEKKNGKSKAEKSAPAVQATAATAPAKARGMSNPEAKAKAAGTRAMRAKINAYLSLKNRPATATGEGSRAIGRAERIAELRQTLASGVKSRPSPKWGTDANGKRIRVGTDHIDSPLKPLERADIQAEIRRLESVGVAKIPTEVRAEALAVLRAYAERSGYDADNLRAAGFDNADLIEAGVIASPSATDTPIVPPVTPVTAGALPWQN